MEDSGIDSDPKTNTRLEEENVFAVSCGYTTDVIALRRVYD